MPPARRTRTWSPTSLPATRSRPGCAASTSTPAVRAWRAWRIARRLPGRIIVAGCPHNFRSDRRSPLVRPFVSRDEAHILHNTALAYRGDRALEIGCWMGWSACHLAAAGVALDVIDPLLAHPDIDRSVRISLTAAGVHQRVRLLPDSSPAAVFRLQQAEALRWDLLFIDGNHNRPGPLQDAIAAPRQGRRGRRVGVVPRPGVARGGRGAGLSARPGLADHAVPDGADHGRRLAQRPALPLSPSAGPVRSPGRCRTISRDIRSRACPPDRRRRCSVKHPAGFDPQRDRADRLEMRIAAPGSVATQVLAVAEPAARTPSRGRCRWCQPPCRRTRPPRPPRRASWPAHRTSRTRTRAGKSIGAISGASAHTALQRLDQIRQRRTQLCLVARDV